MACRRSTPRNSAAFERDQEWGGIGQMPCSEALRDAFGKSKGSDERPAAKDSHSHSPKPYAIAIAISIVIDTVFSGALVCRRRLPQVSAVFERSQKWPWEASSEWRDQKALRDAFGESGCSKERQGAVGHGHSHSRGFLSKALGESERFVRCTCVGTKGEV